MKELMHDLDRLPSRIRQDEVPTKNRMGYMKLNADKFSEEFIDFSINTKETVLEIGSAYGLIARKILAKGGKIIACDLSKEHLDILVDSVDIDVINNLETQVGKFPNEIEIEEKAVKAVLISRVMHFLEPEEIEEGLEKIYSWLKDDGKLYFTAVTAYAKSIAPKFLSIYKERVKKQEKWPGVIRNNWEIAPQHEQYVGNFLNVFDIPQLEVLLPKHGFQIEKLDYFDYPNCKESNGKSHVGFVARKINN